MEEPEELGIVDALAQLSFLVQNALADIAARHDVSLVQARLLGVLRDREPTMNELGRHLGLDKSSVSGLIDRAERRGLVARMASEQDRRVTRVRITEEGRRLATEGEREFEASVRILVRDLPAQDQETLTRIATRVLADARRSRAGWQP